MIGGDAVRRLGLRVLDQVAVQALTVTDRRLQANGSSTKSSSWITRSTGKPLSAASSSSVGRG